MPTSKNIKQKSLPINITLKVVINTSRSNTDTQKNIDYNGQKHALQGCPCFNPQDLWLCYLCVKMWFRLQVTASTTFKTERLLSLITHNPYIPGILKRWHQRGLDPQLLALVREKQDANQGIQQLLEAKECEATNSLLESLDRNRALRKLWLLPNETSSASEL